VSATGTTAKTKTAPGEDEFARRVASADWTSVIEEVDEYGCALLPRLLTVEQCRSLAGLYDEDDRFRSTVHMRRRPFRSIPAMTSAAVDRAPNGVVMRVSLMVRFFLLVPAKSGGVPPLCRPA
jgi:hypothetical protein